MNEKTGPVLQSNRQFGESKEDESMQNAHEIQRILSSEDPEFRQWVEEHHQCEERLGQLTAKRDVSTEEELEEKTLKKRKLRLKDQMAARIRNYENQHVDA